MAHSKDIRVKARNMYVNGRHTMPAISVSLDVPVGTLNRWKTDAKKNGDDWDIARSASTMATEGFDKLVSDAVEGFTIMFQATMDQIQDAGDIEPAAKVKLMASLSDAFNKMINSAGRAAPNISKLGVANEVLIKLAEFVQKDFEHHAEAFLEILEPFGLEIAKAYTE